MLRGHASVDIIYYLLFNRQLNRLKEYKPRSFDVKLPFIEFGLSETACAKLWKSIQHLTQLSLKLAKFPTTHSIYTKNKT